MVGRWREPSAFRADPAAVPATRPSRRQTVALLAVLVLIAGAVAIASYVVRPEKARAFQLFHGSVFLGYQDSPVAVDLATGRPTLTLLNASKQVGVTGTQKMGVVPLDTGTLLVNETTGEFNMVASTGFLVKHDGSGVPLGSATGRTSAMGVADGQLAYVVRTGSAGTDVYLVSQSTVESALFATRAVKPRASTTMSGEVADTAPGGAVAADGSLWLLTHDPGADSPQRLRRLTVPDGSSAGAVLAGADRATVTGASALGTATDGASTTVGLASGDRIRLWSGTTAKPRTVRFRAAEAPDQVLPATNADGRLAFLLHDTTGWSVVSVNADGSGLVGPRPVGDVPADAKLVQPAYSGGALYTVDRDERTLFRIALDGRGGNVPGMETYPVTQGGQSDDFDDVQVIGRGSRVIINSPTFETAAMIFTDGSHPPQIIRKSTAVPVDASGGADALTRSTIQAQHHGPTPPKGGKPKTTGPVVNNKIDCKNTTQKPHIPRIDSQQPGSRSVTLSWTYPIIDRAQDCYPSTYVVSIKLLSNNAPSPPSSVRVQSQTGATITGLFPESKYELTLTAYINGQSTSADPIQVNTGPEGPAAPTGLAVAADSSGNWILNWNSCGSVQQGCVPAQSWTVTPSFCDGRGLSSPPDPITTTADPTSRQQPTVRYPGRDELLGRGLQFVVTGSGASQVPGTPSVKSACVYSWRPAVASALRLSASVPATTELGNATTANVTLDLGDNPVRDVGGVGAQVVLSLTGNGRTQTKQLTFDGRTSTVSANFGGVEAGAAYTAGATVRPAHGGSAVPIPSVNVSTRANWPAVTMTGSCPRGGVLAFSCPLTVQLNGITSAQARGERFDFDGLLSCGSAAGVNFSRQNFDPAEPIDAGSVSLLANFGDCVLTGTLKENAAAPSPQVFGGQPKTVPAAHVDLGSAPTAGAGQGDFDVAWSNDNTGSVRANIRYTGSQDLGRLTKDWSEVLIAPDGDTVCDSGNDMPDTSLTASAQCIAQFAGANASWTVRLGYANTSNGDRVGPFNYSLANPLPNYHYCAPTGFTATWGATKAAGVGVDSSGGDLSGCSDWSYELDSPQNPCGTANGAPPATISLDAQCTDDPAQGTWKVTVSWSDSAGRPQKSDPIPVTGPPPTQ